MLSDRIVGGLKWFRGKNSRPIIIHFFVGDYLTHSLPRYQGIISGSRRDLKMQNAQPEITLYPFIQVAHLLTKSSLAEITMKVKWIIVLVLGLV